MSGERPEAADTDWAAYYALVSGREPRELVLRAAAWVGAPGHAVDLGCGDGTETAWLLGQGWSVTAVDRTQEAVPLVWDKVSATPGGDESAQTVLGDRLETVVAELTEYRLPEADLVLASVSLPFLSPEAFEPVWTRARAALRPGGVLAVNLFGVRDSWAQPDTGPAGMTFHTRAEVEELVADLETLELDEQEYDGPSGLGPKHWHRFDVIARAPDARPAAP